MTPTDIVKQIQEALEFYAGIDAGIKQLLAGFNATPDMRDENSIAERVLKLIPDLLAELERAEKGVSLKECAKEVYNTLWVKNVGEYNCAIAKAVLDKAGVKYHD